MDSDTEERALQKSPQKTAERVTDPVESDEEPLMPSSNVNIADVGDEKPLRFARKRKLIPRAARNANTFSRIERLIEQQLLDDKEQPIWNASDGAVQDLLDDTMPLVAPCYETAPRKTKTPAPRKVAFKKSPRPTKTTSPPSKKWKFRDLGSDESDDEPLTLGGNVDDMVRNAEQAARNAGEGAPDEEIAIQTRKALDDLLVEYHDEIITAEDLAPKAKRPRIALGPTELRVRRIRDRVEPTARRGGDRKALVKRSASKPTNDSTIKSRGTWGQVVDDWSSDDGDNNNSKDWWKKSWDDDKKKWSEKSSWDDKSNGWGEKNNWGDNKWKESPPAPAKKLTIKINAGLKQAFLERRNSVGTVSSIGTMRSIGPTIDPIAARRNIAVQRRTCAEYARMASYPGLRS